MLCYLIHLNNIFGTSIRNILRKYLWNLLTSIKGACLKSAELILGDHIEFRSTLFAAVGKIIGAR